MILIVTNKLDPTADMVIAELYKRDAEFIRFNTEDFPDRIQCSVEIDNSSPLNVYFDFDYDKQIALSQIKSVYYRRPKPPQPNSEIMSNEARDFVRRESRAALSGIWMTLPCLWLNHPHRIQAAELKIDQLRVARQIGLAIPKTIVTNDPQKVRDFYHLCNRKIVAKVLRSGMVEYEDKISLIYTNKIAQDHLDVLETVRYAPSIFQEYIPKKVEIRVTVVGDRIFAAEIHSQNSERTKDDWRRYDIENTPHLAHTLPKKIEQKCFHLINHYGLNFGCIDLIQKPDNEYIFLEINPNGQWGWIEELTELPICNAITNLLLQGESSQQ